MNHTLSWLLRTAMFPVLAAACLLLAPAAWADQSDRADRGPAKGTPKIPYFVDENTLPFEALEGFEDADRRWGVIKNAGFRLEVPAQWNGVLVMWAHGFRGTGLELTVDNHPLRPLLLSLGYAWAASSYSKNDYNVEAGAVDTARLALHFQREVAQPRKTVITGASMGGHVTAASIEWNKKFYDGALAICGVLGDFELFDYFLDFNLAAQQIALGDSVFPVDADYPLTTAQDIKRELELFSGGWPVVLNEKGEAFKQLVELRSGGDRPNFDEAWFFWNSFPSFGSNIPGNFLFDLGVGDGTLPGRPGRVVQNTDVVYQTDLDPALSAFEKELNQGIFRVKADPGARVRRGIRNVPPLEGDIAVPILTLHNLGDMFVPFHNQIEYLKDVTAQGNAHLLVQRAIRGVGHCGFTAEEFSGAFLDLMTWLNTGVRPAGDDLSSPASVADPNFGCAFTDDPLGQHLFAASCP